MSTCRAPFVTEFIATHKWRGEGYMLSTRTIFKTTFQIVPWTLGIPTQIVPFDLDVIPIALIPNHWFLCSRCAVAWIVFAPDRRPRRCDRLEWRRIRNDSTPIRYHVHVWFPTAIRNLEYKPVINRRKRFVSRSFAYPVHLLVVIAKS